MPNLRQTPTQCTTMRSKQETRMDLLRLQAIARLHSQKAVTKELALQPHSDCKTPSTSGKGDHGKHWKDHLQKVDRPRMHSGIQRGQCLLTLTPDKRDKWTDIPKAVQDDSEQPCDNPWSCGRTAGWRRRRRAAKFCNVKVFKDASTRLA